MTWPVWLRMFGENEWGNNMHHQNGKIINKKIIFSLGFFFVLLFIIFLVKPAWVQTLTEDTRIPETKDAQTNLMKTASPGIIIQPSGSAPKAETVTSAIQVTQEYRSTSTSESGITKTSVPLVESPEPTQNPQSDVCILPCWLGIMPDGTSMDDARKILIGTGSQVFEPKDHDFFFGELWSTIEYNDNKNINSVDIAVVSKDNETVDGIYLIIEREKQIHKFGSELRVLDIAEIFAEYGNPQQMMVYSGSYGSARFYLWMYYPEFLIRYEGIANEISNHYQICPRLSSGYLRSIRVYTFGKDKSLMYWIRKDVELFGSSIDDFTQTTDKSIDEIRAIFAVKGGKECIETYPIIPEQ